MTLLPVRPKAMCISCYVNILTDKNSAKLYWKNSILNYEIEITALLSAFNLCWLWYNSSNPDINNEWIIFFKLY